MILKSVPKMVIALVTSLTLFSCSSNPVESGVFFSIEQAFSEGWLSTNDLEIISYYYDQEVNGFEKDNSIFVPSPMTPSTLSSSTQDLIKQTYLNRFLSVNGDYDIEMANVKIDYYLGTYDDCVIVGVTDNYFNYDYLFEKEHIIGDILFNDYCPAFAQVWRLS